MGLGRVISPVLGSFDVVHDRVAARRVLGHRVVTAATRWRRSRYEVELGPETHHRQ